MESGCQRDEASDGICKVGKPNAAHDGAELCRVWAPQGASPVQTQSWGAQSSSWSEAVLEANPLFLFSDAPCLPSPLPVPSIYVST